MKTLLLVCAVLAVLMLCGYLAACAGAQRWLNFRKWLFLERDDGGNRSPAPTWTRESGLGNPRDLPEIPGAGGERWSQAPLGDTHPVATTTPPQGATK